MPSLDHLVLIRLNLGPWRNAATVGPATPDAPAREARRATLPIRLRAAPRNPSPRSPAPCSPAAGSTPATPSAPCPDPGRAAAPGKAPGLLRRLQARIGLRNRTA